MIPYVSYDGAEIITVISDFLIIILQIYAINKIGYKIILWFRKNNNWI